MFILKLFNHQLNYIINKKRSTGLGFNGHMAGYQRLWTDFLSEGLILFIITDISLFHQS